MTQENQEQKTMSKKDAWIQAVRAFSFTASMVPIFVGAVLAINYEGHASWEFLPIIVVCALLYHAATNLISDYYDHINGVDKDYTFGSSRVIQDGLLEPKQILRAGWLFFAIAIALGFVLIAARGLPIFYIGLIGFLGGWAYTADPIGYKYKALGDLLVFTLMGPLMVIGSYLALTGEFSWVVLIVSLPVGFLVAAILHANNHRDIIHDSEAKVMTVANRLGHDGSKLYYYFLVIAAYISVVGMVATQIVSPWALIVFLSLPPAMKNMKMMKENVSGDVKAIAMIDVQTAQHHLLFGLLLIIALLVGAFTG